MTNLGSLSASALTRRNILITIRLQKSNLSSMCIHIFEFFLLMFWGGAPNCAYKKQWYASPSIICLAFGLKIVYVGKGKVFFADEHLLPISQKIILLQNIIKSYCNGTSD